LANAISSRTDFTGSDGCTTSTIGPEREAGNRRQVARLNRTAGFSSGSGSTRSPIGRAASCGPSGGDFATTRGAYRAVSRRARFSTTTGLIEAVLELLRQRARPPCRWNRPPETATTMRSGALG